LNIVIDSTIWIFYWLMTIPVGYWSLRIGWRENVTFGGDDYVVETEDRVAACVCFAGGALLWPIVLPVAIVYESVHKEETEQTFYELKQKALKQRRRQLERELGERQLAHEKQLKDKVSEARNEHRTWEAAWLKAGGPRRGMPELSYWTEQEATLAQRFDADLKLAGAKSKFGNMDFSKGGRT
jgi:hypothetical protein